MWNFKRDIYRTRREDNCPNCIAHDIDIYGQVWTGCNLNVTTYSDGITVIPEVTDSTAWANLTTGAWCHYNDDPANEPIYGKLYNWYAVAGIYDAASFSNPSLRKQLAPTGYHVPSETEWLVLRDNLGGSSDAGGKMKEEGLCHWINPNTDATNTSLFTGLPAGFRDSNGPYTNIGENGVWWTTTEDTFYSGFARSTFFVNYNGIFGNGDSLKDEGHSVRLIKDGDCPDCVAHTVDINGQIWTGCNANTSFYNNGDPIPYVDNASTWQGLTTGAWCYYDNDPSTEATYGKLYNWYAVNDPRGIAPSGYHVPTDADWTILTTFLGGESVAGGKMKEEGFCHWVSPNTGATNTSLFTALPGGFRNNNGNYYDVGYFGGWWSSTDANIDVAWSRFTDRNYGFANRSFNNKEDGFSLRFVKDVVCPDVDINGQIWTSCNLNVSKYRDGTIIPYVPNAGDWSNLTTAGWCYYDNDPSTEAVYGKLYNWYAVNDTSHGGIAPSGYHIPTDSEWTTLINSLGGLIVAGGKLKEMGTTHWIASVDATNESGFTALPGGYRNSIGNYLNSGFNGYWWSSTASGAFQSWSYSLDASYGNAYRSFNPNNYAFSIRLIKD